jgi:hypothetical protein
MGMYLMKKLISLILICSSLNADMFQPSYYCSKPHKPYEFKSQWEVDSFKNGVKRYKECINEFIEQQNNAINTHKAAANQAVKDWNDYVRRELN